MCGLKTLYVRSNLPPQKPLAAMSRRAPSCTFEEAPLSVSLVIGCRVGSVQTLLQTSVKPPLGMIGRDQLRSLSHNRMLMGSVLVASCNVRLERPGRHLCEEQTRTHQWAVMSANLKPPEKARSRPGLRHSNTKGLDGVDCCFCASYLASA